MSGIQGFLLSYLLLYKYYALALVVYSGAVLLPLPVNASLLAVGAFASQGYFNFWASLAIAVGANTAGDLTDYVVARKYGTTVIHFLRFDKLRFLHQLTEEFRTDAAVTVFVTRFAGSLSTVSNFFAGIAMVPFGTFLFYDFLGNFIEPGAALGIGYAVGNYWDDFSGISSTIAGVVAVAITMFILFRIHRRITRKYAS